MPVNLSTPLVSIEDVLWCNWGHIPTSLTDGLWPAILPPYLTTDLLRQFSCEALKIRAELFVLWRGFRNRPADRGFRWLKYSDVVREQKGMNEPQAQRITAFREYGDPPFFEPQNQLEAPKKIVFFNVGKDAFPFSNKVARCYFLFSASHADPVEIHNWSIDCELSNDLLASQLGEQN